MRAAKMKERPGFTLMRQTDIQSVYHMQMPRWLFSDPRYADMSLDAKIAYTFLLNRFQLSRRNGWVNEYGEVFVIFPRKALAAELRICEQRVTAAFRKLTELKLIWEKRCGRGDANQIYLATVTPTVDETYECAPFLSPEDDGGGFRTADSEALDGQGDTPHPQEAPKASPKNHGKGDSRNVDFAAPEPPEVRPSDIELSHIDLSQKEVSQSVPPAPVREVGPTADEEAELEEILDGCELYCLEPEVARVFENAVERLFYSDSVRIGGATLPRSRVRRKLRLLDGTILQDASAKLHANLDQNVRNSTAYTMSTILNAIAESESDLLVDPYLNSLRTPPFPPPKGGDAGCF